jgi:hypothetical protein
MSACAKLRKGSVSRLRLREHGGCGAASRLEYDWCRMTLVACADTSSSFFKCLRMPNAIELERTALRFVVCQRAVSGRQ